MHPDQIAFLTFYIPGEDRRGVLIALERDNRLLMFDTPTGDLVQSQPGTVLLDTAQYREFIQTRGRQALSGYAVEQLQAVAHSMGALGS